jgi:hypothetical protein
MDSMLRPQILNMEPHVTSQMTSRKICGGQSGTREDFLLSYFISFTNHHFSNSLY